MWREGKPVRAVWTISGDSLTAEVLGNAGFDAVLLDMQHGFGIDPDKAGRCFQAISATPAIPMARVPWNDPVHIQYALDSGCYGVIVPLVNTPEEAARAAGATRYPPVGFRSNGPNRVIFYGGADYVENANDEIICLVMIETLEAISNIEAIAATPGIDGFFIGPGDLAMSMGLTPGAAASDASFHGGRDPVRDVAQRTGWLPASRRLIRRRANAYRCGVRVLPDGKRLGISGGGSGGGAARVWRIDTSEVMQSTRVWVLVQKGVGHGEFR